MTREIRFSNERNAERPFDEKIVKENDRFLKVLKDNSIKSNSNYFPEVKESLMTKDKENTKDVIREVEEAGYNAIVAKKREEKKKDTKGGDMKVAKSKQHVSLKFGVVGSGQAGGRIAEVFYKYGYKTCAVNTARQDLEYLSLPEENKLFIGDEDLGGAGRDLEFGYAAVEENEDKVISFMEEKLEGCTAAVLSLAGGGGSGSGSAELLIEYLSKMGLPIVVIFALPGTFDDPQSKHNAIQTLSKLSEFANKQVINSLVLVDNAKIEMSFPDLSPAVFWKTANNAVVEPLHMFNTLSAMPTDYESLDSMDFAKSLIEAGNCVVFGQNEVSSEDYQEDETALLEAMIDNLENGLLASGFNLSEAQNVGVLITARDSVLQEIPNNSLSYVFKYITEEFDSAKSFKGIYSVPSDNDNITIRFIFSGLGLPKQRVESLKAEAKKHMDALEDKKKNTSMRLDLGKDKTKSKADRAMNKIKRKKSAIGKLKSRTSTPRRR